jgi:hypothetical protein
VRNVVNEYAWLNQLRKMVIEVRMNGYKSDYEEFNPPKTFNELKFIIENRFGYEISYPETFRKVYYDKPIKEIRVR